MGSATMPVGDPEIATRISQYELAYRMQASVPELADISNEPKEVLDMYGRTSTYPEPMPPIACWPAGLPSAM